MFRREMKRSSLGYRNTGIIREGIMGGVGEKNV
jgi:hypothetical protein